MKYCGQITIAELLSMRPVEARNWESRGALFIGAA